ncbi:MAG: hypothetical protein JRI99_15145, partial [Deltaproteobacteria bacterium]|nr:hypothetical protein [Deltaproteobacteria bacterium]
MKYKNALCIYPYQQELKTVGFFPPIGLEYVATAIEDMVETVKVIDFRHEKKSLDSFMHNDTDLVLISHNWDTEEAFVKATINRIPNNITVIVGGRYASEHVDELFEDIPR